MPDTTHNAIDLGRLMKFCCLVFGVNGVGVRGVGTGAPFSVTGCNCFAHVHHNCVHVCFDLGT